MVRIKYIVVGIFFSLTSCLPPTVSSNKIASKSLQSPVRETSLEDRSKEETTLSKNTSGNQEQDVSSQQMTASYFTDITMEAGIKHQVKWESKFDKHHEFVASGVAIGDYDNDGWDDLAIAQLDGFYLYQNQGDGTFRESSSQAGIHLKANTSGASWVDIDNDGDLDLYVTTIEVDFVNHYYLFVNDGQGQFKNEARERGAGLPDSSSPGGGGYSIAVGDYDRDQWLDLHISEWGKNFKTLPIRPNGLFLKNLGQGKFEDRTIQLGITFEEQLTSARAFYKDKKYSFGASFIDLDQDDWLDLAVVGDFSTSKLYWNNQGSFQDDTIASQVGTDQNGMGYTFADLNGDGLLDWFVTAIYNSKILQEREDYSGNRLYINKGNRLFEDQTDQWGLRDGGWGWGTVFFDYDNDGDPDLFMENGWEGDVSQADCEPVQIPCKRYYKQPSFFWENIAQKQLLEKTKEVGLGFEGNGRGVAYFDYDKDGDLDLIIINHDSSPRLLRNEKGNQNQYLRVKVKKGKRDAIGAKVWLKKKIDSQAMSCQLGVNTLFLGQSESWCHFGLGADSGPIYELKIRWIETGKEKVFKDVQINQALVIEESP